MESNQAEFYKNIVPISTAHGDMRIYAPISYAAVREIQAVPIVHIEALALAAWFPICWQSGKNLPSLIVLRSLRCDGTCQPTGSPETMTSLPLLLRAYPFAVPLSHAPVSGDFHLDDAIADRPTDVGAPILQPDGRLGRGAQMRLRAVQAYEEARRLTDEMTNVLKANDLFEPWPLDFKIGEEQLSIGGILIIRQTAFGQASIQQFLARFGAAGALFLGAHRISLFRAGNLVQAARQKIAVNTSVTN